jgi:hypothetical protein
MFRRWVTTDVLPSIRKTGRYEWTPPLGANFGPIPPAGHGNFALLPTPSGEPVADLATEHMSSLLSCTIGETAGEWSGKLADLISVARSEHLFWWVLRDPTDWRQRVAFGVTLRRRVGVFYSGIACTRLKLHALGRDRHRKYLITREEGVLS